MKLVISLIALFSLQSAFAITSINGNWEGKNLRVDENFSGIFVYIGSEVKAFNIDRIFGDRFSSETRIYNNDNKKKIDINIQTGTFNSITGVLPCGNVSISRNGSLINGSVCGTDFMGIYFDHKVEANAAIRKIVLDELTKGLPKSIQGAVALKIQRKTKL